ncbi:MAG: threonine/serine exporter family protein [Clostridia bacterium]|nr:threonine/serine exporter family protein [Clostridia bacterium]
MDGGRIQPKTEQEERRVLNAAMDAGHILLQNGAEISRVEETMERICRHYGVMTGEFFVLSNGIFTTGGQTSDKTFARVQHIPVKGASMDKIVAVNQLSREIEDGKYESIDDVERKLEEIRRMKGFAAWQQILASGVGSGFFCVLFGGGFADCAAAFIAGILLYIYVLKVSAPHLSKIVGNIIGGMLIVLLSLASYHIGLGVSLSPMISGAIMPLVPGVAFTNGIRDIANGDYISGAVRMLDAVLIFLSIAIGMGVMFTIYHSMTGGIMP